MMNYVIVVICWVAYLALHSLFASQSVKDQFNKYRFFVRYYRLFYSVISGIGLIFLLFLLIITPSKLLLVVPGYLKYIAMVLASWGVIIVVVSFRYISGWEFLGMKKAVKTELIREGIHGYVRHPIYLGTILILVGLVLFNPTDIVMLSVSVVFIYFPFGIRFEEQRLLKELGEEYEKYKNEVPSILPKLRR